MKKYLTALVAVVLALAFTAFKPAPAKSVQHKGTRTHAFYQLTTGIAGDETNPSKWLYIDGQDPDTIECEGENVLCTIYAPEGSFPYPDFTNVTDPRDDDDVELQVYKP